MGSAPGRPAGPGPPRPAGRQDGRFRPAGAGTQSDRLDRGHKLLVKRSKLLVKRGRGGRCVASGGVGAGGEEEGDDGGVGEGGHVPEAWSKRRAKQSGQKQR